MKNIFCLMLLITIANSCKVTQANYNNLKGTYTAMDKDYYYRLVLNSDNTFELKFKVLEANSGCEGKWRLEGAKLLILTCDEPKNVSETLQGGYMSNRIRELKVKSTSKFIFNGVILKRLPEINGSAKP